MANKESEFEIYDRYNGNFYIRKEVVKGEEFFVGGASLDDCVECSASAWLSETDLLNLYLWIQNILELGEK